MKIVKTASVGSLVALTGAAGLWYSASAGFQVVIEILMYRPGGGPIVDHTHRLAWSVVSAAAVAVGVMLAVCGFVRANRTLGVSPFGRLLLILADVAVVAAAVPMLYAASEYFYHLRMMSAGEKIWSAEHWRDVYSCALGSNLGFALLPGLPVVLLIASFTAMRGQPDGAPSGCLPALSVGLTVFLAIVFAGAFVPTWIHGRSLYSLIGSPGEMRPSEVRAMLSVMVTARLLAVSCLALLSIPLGTWACLLRGESTRRAN
jgi:hypothetical protein